jgi:hypothetical protein
MAPMKAAHRRLSYADLERCPEDGRSGRLHLALTDYVSTHGGTVLYAPLDIVLTEYDVVQPDLLLFTRDREGLLDLVPA